MCFSEHLSISFIISKLHFFLILKSDNVLLVLSAFLSVAASPRSAVSIPFLLYLGSHKGFSQQQMDSFTDELRSK